MLIINVILLCLFGLLPILIEFLIFVVRFLLPGSDARNWSGSCSLSLFWPENHFTFPSSPPSSLSASSSLSSPSSQCILYLHDHHHSYLLRDSMKVWLYQLPHGPSTFSCLIKSCCTIVLHVDRGQMVKMVMIVEFLGEWKPFEKQLFCQLVIMTMIMIHHGKPFASKRVGINNNYKNKNLILMR